MSNTKQPSHTKTKPAPLYLSGKKKPVKSEDLKIQMIGDVLGAVPLDDALDGILNHFEHRAFTPDEADKLMNFANKIGRKAWSLI